MRTLLLIPLLVLLGSVHGQHLDPDQQPYWTRYTFVEDSAVLVPLKGDYQVFYLQSGMWWTYMPPDHRIHGLPEKGLRLQPVFSAELPKFQATPARGTEQPEVKVVVVREQDTMVVTLSTYYQGMGSLVNERCKKMDCTRRPPVVLPFRPGLYFPNGRSLYQDTESIGDPLTTSLTEQFDALWKKAMKEGRVVPQLNTDTCQQELVLPPDPEPNRTPMRDAWVLRSPYCGTHLVHFPLKGSRCTYNITFIPYSPGKDMDPVTLDTSALDDVNYWLDITDWPIGDHPVRLVADGVEESFTLKLR